MTEKGWLGLTHETKRQIKGIVATATRNLVGTEAFDSVAGLENPDREKVEKYVEFLVKGLEK